MAIKTGNANYEKGKGFKKRNRYNLTEKDQVFRIFGPMGELAESGTWSVFQSVHYGYKNTEGKHRPFLSTQTRTRKGEKVPDAALDRYNDLRTKRDEYYKAGNAPMGQALAVLVGNRGQRGVYNVSNNHHMNVMTLEGNIGELALRHTAMLKLKVEIDKLRAEGVDPLSWDNGRYFVMSRSNTGKDTTFNVSVYKEKKEIPNLGKVEMDFVSKIGPDVLARLESEAADLSNLFPKVTSEEIAQIVAQSDLKTGKSPACDEFFDKRWKAAREAREAAKKAQVATVAAPTAVDPTPQYDPDDDYTPPEEPATASPLVAAANPSPVKPLETPVAKETKTVLATPAPKSQAKSIDEMSDAEFFAKLELDSKATQQQTA